MPGQVYSVSSLGGVWSVPYLSDRIRNVAQPMFALRQFCDVKEAIGKKRGDTWLFDKTQNVDTQGGTLVETATIPETQFNSQQGTGTITEYGNSIPFTAKLQALGQFEVEPQVELHLRDDQVKVLESAAGAQFAATDFIAVCTTTAGVAITTNGTATATATSNLTAANVRQIVNFMKKRHIPRYDGRSYMCVASVSALSGFHEDTASAGWVDISKYTAPFSTNLHNGEVGSYFGVRFVEETGYLSSTIGSGSDKGQAVIFGADAVYEAVTIPEEIRMKIPDDYGRSMGMAWYALLGFKIVWNFAADNEQHIVFVTSA
jgi:N4-gp56 family major capsid protein